MTPVLFLLTSLLAAAAPEDDSAATAVDVKGVVQVRGKLGALESLFKGKKVSAHSTVITAAGASAKLLFVDGSEIIVQPSTQFRVDMPPTDEKPGVFSLMAGGLRAKFSKAINDKPKALIRTNNSVMGVRGTEFQAGYNPQNRVASVVTFEGQVAMVGADGDSIRDTGRLLRSYSAAMGDSSRVALVGAGQYSGVTPGVAPSIPVRISPAQLESLRQVTPAPGAATTAPVAGGVVPGSQGTVSSPVPPGVDARLLAVEAPSALQADSMAGTPTPNGGMPVYAPTLAPPEGYVDSSTGRVAPPAGGFVDVQSGVYVPPPPGSSFDAVAQVFVPPPTVGSFNGGTGAYSPPPGLTLDPLRGLVAVGSVASPSVAAPAPTAALPGAPLSPGAAPAPGPYGAVTTEAPPALLFAGVDPAQFGDGMMAAPPPPGTELRAYMAPREVAGGDGTAALPPPATVVLADGGTGADGNHVSGGYHTVPPPPGGQYYAGYDGFQPQYPVYNPFLCPPYCDPAFQPGFYPGMPVPLGDTRVNFIINE